MYDLHKAPPPFNPRYRPGLAGELERQYNEYCEKNLDATREELRQAHRRIYESIKDQFPEVGEEGCTHG